MRGHLHHGPMGRHHYHPGPRFYHHPHPMGRRYYHHHHPLAGLLGILGIGALLRHLRRW